MGFSGSEDDEIDEEESESEEESNSDKLGRKKRLVKGIEDDFDLTNSYDYGDDDDIDSYKYK